MRIALRNARRVHAGSALLENAHVLVAGSRIESVQQEPITVRVDASIDLAGCLLIPGLVSLHHHFFQHVTRAWPGLHRAASKDWLAGLYPVWARMDAGDIAAAARVAAAELLLSGCTTCADHAFLLRDRGEARLAAQVGAVRELGLRQHLVRSGLPGMFDAEEPWLEQCRADLEHWHDPSPDSMLRLDLGPSNVAYDKPRLMESLAALAAERGVGLHAHLHPRQAEREQCRRLHGCGPVEFLGKRGWLGQRTWFAHCTELDADDIARFAAGGVGIAHCPRTVLRLGYRIPPLHAWRAAGIRVGFGADGGASNDGGAFISDVRLGMLLHRAGTADVVDPRADWLSPEDALRMATRDAALILGRADLGTLEAGALADLAAFDLRGLELAGALNDPLAGFLLAGTQPRAKLTMVNGRITVRDGELAGTSAAELAREAHERSARLLRL